MKITIGGHDFRHFPLTSLCLRISAPCDVTMPTNISSLCRHYVCEYHYHLFWCHYVWEYHLFWRHNALTYQLPVTSLYQWKSPLFDATMPVYITSFWRHYVRDYQLLVTSQCLWISTLFDVVIQYLWKSRPYNITMSPVPTALSL